MSTTTQIPTARTSTAHPSAPAPTATARRQPVWRYGVSAAVAASVVTTALAAIASAAGVSFEIDGEPIPLLGFTQLTLVFSLIGVGMAAVMARTARRPRSTFVRTTVALTAVSCVPDLTFGFDAASAATLIALHVVAAAVVVPAIASRLAPTR